MKKELLIGCGESRVKNMSMDGNMEWTNLTTLDFYPECQPDVLHDLNDTPYPFEDDTFDEVHAYEVLEHLGKQGDWKSFFDQFGELHRILKPGGLLLATTPMWDSLWAWGDPSHTRVISNGSITFLSQKMYNIGVGKSAMTDFRHYWKRDFDIVHSETRGGAYIFALQAVKC